MFPFLLSSLSLASWNPGRVHHVDTLGQAHLFRGPAPVSNGTTFVFDALRSTMIAAAKTEAKVDVPNDFVLIVISMLDNIKSSEKQELSTETAYFSKLPAAGPMKGSQLVHWPIIGDVTSPSIYPKKLCQSEAKKLDSHGDKIVTRTAAIRQMLTGAKTPTIVYFHCDAGMDRTGEMYGDYQMRYKNQTYAQVHAYDSSIEGPGGRQINKVNKQALEWMCIYLVMEEGKPKSACNMCM